MDIDLETPRYTNADVLRLVPSLTLGTLQNWVARKVFDRPDADQDVEPGRPKKYKKAQWTGAAVIAMRLMMDLSKFQIGPTQSVVIAEELLQYLDWFLENIKPQPQSNGVSEYVLEMGRMGEYRVAYVRLTTEGEYKVSVHPRSYSWSPIAASLDNVASIHIEVDMLFMQSLNSMTWMDAGLHPMNGEA